MPVIRNPFRKNVQSLAHGSTEPTGVEHLGSPPSSRSNADLGSIEDLDRAFPSVSKSASALSIVKSDKDSNSYKMSVVNDSGVYLPPSPPTDSNGFWKRKESSASVRNRAPVSPSDEQFIISRESFDSYRRSFDISARSPILEGSRSARASMDSRPTRLSLDSRSTRVSLDARSPRMPPTVRDIEEPAENEFEEVKLNDDSRPRRLNIFHRFGDHSSKDGSRVSSRTGFFTRKEHGVETAHGSELKHLAHAEKEAL